MSRRQAEGGYVLVWVLVVLGLLAAGIGSIEFTVDSRPQNPTMHAIFALGAVVAALGMFAEARRDLYAFCGFGLVAAFIAGLLTGAVALLGTRPHPIAAGVSVVAWLGFVACLVYLLRIQFARDTLPDLLRKEFAPSAIYEVGGVQFAVRQSRTELAAGERFYVRVVAQNCWDRERHLTFVLDPELRVSLNRAGLKVPKEAKLRLPGGAVAVLTIPVEAESKAKGAYSLVARPKVSGSGGTRVRRRRAQAPSTRIPPWITALAALGGVLAWGGGMRLEVAVAQRRDGDVPVPGSPLEAETEVVWQPERHELAASA